MKNSNNMKNVFLDTNIVTTILDKKIVYLGIPCDSIACKNFGLVWTSSVYYGQSASDTESVTL